MRELLSGEYIPFGSQYYRAPSPERADWAKDLKSMAELGFNLVKFWLQWRWNHPEENKFYFDDIDELMDLSHRHGLKVMLNTILDVAPAWIYKKFPDASMVTLDGRKIGPQTQPHRQIGGLGYCLNHDGVTEDQFRFLAEVIKRYKDHPALEIWNVGSEPELTSSMAEMRLYADNSDNMNDMLCYCHHCVAKFKIWLEQKYDTIENLNLRWNRNYRSFEEIELPKTRNTFNDMIDWRMFFVDVLGQNVKKRFAVAEKEDKGRHPLMCHHVFIQGFPVTSTANDPWSVGQFGDLHGFTQMNDPMMIDILRSCAKNKPVISAEMLMLPGYTLDLPEPIDENDIKRFIFSGLAGNQKGFIFWQFRPEILGREAPTWGLTWLDGTSSSWLKSFSTVGLVLQKNAHFILNAKAKAADVAILYHPENQIFAWMTTKNEKTATNSLLGVHRALYENNINVDFIHPIEFDSNVLSNYKVLYIPFPYWIGRKLAGMIGQWVESGGILIGESYFAGWNVEGGHHQKIIPGYGLHKIFKARQGLVEYAKDEAFDIFLNCNLSQLEKGQLVKGSLIRESLIPEGAEILATFENNSAAITASSFGRGYAILIGSYIGLSYHRTNFDNNARLMVSLVEKYTDITRPKISETGKVRIDLLKNKENNVMLIVQNLDSFSQRVTIKIHHTPVNELKEQFSNRILTSEPVSEDGIALYRISLEPKEVQVYCD